MQSVLKRLGELPVDTAALQSCGIGRAMNRLKKTGPEGLRGDAAALVAKWKRVVDAESASAAPGDAAAKRDRRAPTWHASHGQQSQDRYLRALVAERKCMADATERLNGGSWQQGRRCAET